MARFLLKQGRHVENSSTKDGPGRLCKTVVDEYGKVIYYQKEFCAMGIKKSRDPETGATKTEYKPCEGFTEEDQYIESDTDLVARFGPEKFQKVVKQWTPVDDGLDRMNIGELRGLAEAEEIELPDRATKDQIKELLRSSAKVASA